MASNYKVRPADYNGRGRRTADAASLTHWPPQRKMAAGRKENLEGLLPRYERSIRRSIRSRCTADKVDAVCWPRLGQKRHRGSPPTDQSNSAVRSSTLRSVVALNWISSSHPSCASFAAARRNTQPFIGGRWRAPQNPNRGPRPRASVAALQRPMAAGRQSPEFRTCPDGNPAERADSCPAGSDR